MCLKSQMYLNVTHDIQNSIFLLVKSQINCSGNVTRAMAESNIKAMGMRLILRQVISKLKS